MTFAEWLNKVEDIQHGLEGRYGMRIDWGHYTHNHDWRADFQDGQTPAVALTGAVTWQMTESQQTRFMTEMVALL